MEDSQWENLNHLFCRNVSLLTAPHCQFRGVCQGMKHLYRWYPLFQAQWDRNFSKYVIVSYRIKHYYTLNIGKLQAILTGS